MKLITQSFIAATTIGISTVAMAASVGPACPSVKQLHAAAAMLTSYSANGFSTAWNHYTARAWNTASVDSNYADPTIFFNPTNIDNQPASLAQAEKIIQGVTTVQGPYSNSIGSKSFYFCTYGGLQNPNYFITVNTQTVDMMAASRSISL